MVRVGLVYPELLGTYGDRGNATVLANRLLWRGIAAEVIEISPAEVLPGHLDIYVIGGGENHAEELALRLLAQSARAFRAVIECGAQVLAVCAGFQMLGGRIATVEGKRLTGLGVIDAHTEPRSERAVGEVLVDTNLDAIGPLTGFENHGCDTELGPAAVALGRITTPGPVRHDGYIDDHIVATYLHGPVLARNPRLADHLLERVVGPLQPLADDPAMALHEHRLRAQGGR